MRSNQRATHRINFRSFIHEATRYAKHRTIFISLIHRMIFRSWIHEAITHLLVYLRRSSSTKATAEPPSHSLIYIYHLTTFFKHYGHCRAGEPPSQSLIYLLRSSSTKATGEPLSSTTFFKQYGHCRAEEPLYIPSKVALYSVVAPDEQLKSNLECYVLANYSSQEILGFATRDYPEYVWSLPTLSRRFFFWHKMYSL